MGQLEARTDKLRVALREHAIILLDVLIDAVDINDFYKLSLSLQAFFLN